jgi:hypothetical protein
MTSQTQRPAAELTARQLTTQLGEQLIRLFMDELALAKAEPFISARQEVLGGGMLAAAAAVGAARRQHVRGQGLGRIRRLGLRAGLAGQAVTARTRG